MSVLAIENTENTKVGNASTTYSGKNTCPNSCPLKAGGCYGCSGPVGVTFRRITDMKRGHIREAISEASKISKLSGLKDLRIHTTGDCKSNEAAKIVSQAADKYAEKNGKKVWTYTHAWRQVSRQSWSKVSVLASCDKVSQIKEANANGYAASLVVSQFKSDKVYIEEGQTILPCPNQVAKGQGKAVTCTECRLCMNDQNLIKNGLTIAFQVHGPTKKARAALEQV